VRSDRATIAELAGVFAGFVAVALVHLRVVAAPLSRLTTHLVPDRGDALFNLTILRWTAHQWSLGLPDLWNAPFFFPTRSALTLSDHLLSPALIFWPLEALVGPIAAYDLLVLISFPATALGMYWMLRKSGTTRGAAWVGAAAATWAPFRWMHLGHLQILLMPLVPVVLWTFDRLLVERTARRGVVFVTAYALHVTGGCYVAFMTHLPMGVIAVQRVVTERWRDIPRKAWIVLAATTIASLGLAVAVFVPYLKSSRDDARTRGIGEITANAATATSFLTASTRNRYQPLDLIEDTTRRAQRRQRGEQSLFPGLVAAVLAPLGLVAWWRRKPSRDAEHDNRHRWQRGLLIGGAASLVLAFATPYLAAAALLPGLSGMRVPARFLAVAWPALALLVATGADALLLLLPSPVVRRTAIPALLAAMAIAESPAHVGWIRTETAGEIPAIHRWLATPAASNVLAILELPLARDARAAQAMFRGGAHWKPIVNGYSGYEPRAFLEIAGSFERFPGPAAFEILRRRGVSHVLVPELAGRAAWESASLGSDLDLERDEGGWRLYRIRAR
jgi:hypothetical protein